MILFRRRGQFRPFVAIALVLAAALLLPSSSNAQNVSALSPTTTYLAYIENGALWLRHTTPGGEPVRVSEVEKYFTVPTWSPAGDRLAYYSKRNGELQLWVYDVRSKRASQATRLAGGISPDRASTFGGWGNDPLRFSWSPDGSKIVFSSVVPRASAATPSAPPHPSFPTPGERRASVPITLTTETPPSWTLHGVVSYGSPSDYNYNNTSLSNVSPPTLNPPTTAQLFIVEVATGNVQQITTDERGYHMPAWSPDGRYIAYMSAGTAAINRFDTLETDIFIRDLRTGVERQVTQGRTQKTVSQWSPDGTQIAYYWRDGRGTFVRAGDGISVVSAFNPEPSPGIEVTRSLDRRPLAFAWALDGKRIFSTYRDGLATPLVSIDVASLDVRALSRTGSVVREFSVGASGVSWVEVTDPNEPAEVLLSANGTDSAVGHLWTLPMNTHGRRVERVTWHNSRSDLIEGVIIYPERYEPGRRYPLIVDAYSNGTIDLEWYREKDVYAASSEYFIFRPNHRAPHMWVNAMKSAVYDAGAVGPRGTEFMADDIMSGVDELDRRGLVDTDKMCVYGFSNGGLEGELLLTQTDRFRCAAFLSPAVSDWLETFFLSTADGEPLHWVYDLDPWKHTEAFISLSPVYLADRIHTPVLLAAGDREPIIIPTIEMYNALRFVGVDVTLLRYPFEGHGLSNGAKADFTGRLSAFFRAHLDQ